MRVVSLAVLAVSCSSWDTGTRSDRAAEQACLDTTEALARAGERCGLEYARIYDQELQKIANGDCKNVTSVRDESALRAMCLPSLATEACWKVIANDFDASCSTQLQRTTSVRPTL
jgi:hypothetical protein